MAVLAFATFSGMAKADERAAEIGWRSGVSAARPVMQVDEMAQSLASIREAGHRHALAQFARGLTHAEREAARARGLALLSPLPGHAYFVRLEGEAVDVAALVKSAPLVRLEAVASAWKLHPVLGRGDVPAWAVVAHGGEDQHDVLALYVMLHGDAAQAGTKAQLEALGGVVISALRAVNVLVVELPAARVVDAAALDDVQWIEPALPAMGPQNDLARESIGADILQDEPYSLDGGAVRVMVYDVGLVDATHPDLADRVTWHDTTSVSQHATHVAGIVGGSGMASAGQFRGMAPEVAMASYGFEPEGSAIALYTDPGDIERDYDDAINVADVDMANNSIGSNIALLGLPCELEGDYSAVSALVDAIVYGELGRELPIMWAAGNERIFPANCGSGWHTIPPPATAKNAVVVGAVYSDFDVITTFSSYGPTDDGRIKPDVVAPGCELDGDNGVTSANLGGGYIPFCGTSMATPAVTGVVALMLQDVHRQAPSGSPDPSPALIKAVLVQTALDLWHDGPDYRYGYGLVQADQAVEHLRSGNVAEAAVSQDEVWTAPLMVEPGTTSLVATLAWIDPPAAPNVETALVNDIDLRIVGPDGTFFPWTLNPNQPSADAVRTQPDRLNTIEQVLVENPTPGIWQVEVDGYDVASGEQSFAVAAGSTIVHVELDVPGGVPTEVIAGETLEVDVNVTAVGEALLAQSLRVHHRVPGQVDFQSQPLMSLGGTSYRARLPAVNCDEMVEFYFSYAGSVSGVHFDPPAGPAQPYEALAVDETEVALLPASAQGGFDVSGAPPVTSGGTAPTTSGDGTSPTEPTAQVTSVERCLDPRPVGDVDGDHEVDGFDLANLLYYWGTDEIVADLDANWNVDGFDLAILLGNWSP